jgi:2,3-bisphosphoglycerate-dependent phosphoglycerate mutase
MREHSRASDCGVTLHASSVESLGKCIDMLEVFLARHGETDWNAEQRIQGSVEIALNGKGQAQAQALGTALMQHHQEKPFTRLICSDQSRTRSTIAPFVAQSGLHCEYSPWWRERCFGVLEGLRQQEIAERFPQLEAAWRERRLGNWLPGGESIDGISQRVCAALNCLAQSAHVGQRVLVVTHGGGMDAAYRLATGMAWQAPRTFSIGNCELSALHFDGANWSVKFWGDSGHLSAL